LPDRAGAGCAAVAEGDAHLASGRVEATVDEDAGGGDAAPGGVVNAGNALEREQKFEGERDLFGRRGGVLDALVLVVVVEEADEVAAGFAVRANQGLRP
jgi:hypothetical protein